MKAASKLLKEAELNESYGDEEIAYVLYMRYFNLISGIKKTSEYKKDEVSRKREKKENCFLFWVFMNVFFFFFLQNFLLSNLRIFILTVKRMN